MPIAKYLYIYFTHSKKLNKEVRLHFLKRKSGKNKKSNGTIYEATAPLRKY